LGIFRQYVSAIIKLLDRVEPIIEVGGGAVRA